MGPFHDGWSDCLSSAHEWIRLKDSRYRSCVLDVDRVRGAIQVRKSTKGEQRCKSVDGHMVFIGII